jgi:DNA repair photolyase
MIVSASRRTDIPAFYAAWFMNRVAAGSCEVPNPYHHEKRSVVSLRPEDVDCFVFWTRHPSGLVPRLPELSERGYRWYFLFTLLDYPGSFEPYSPSFERRLELLRSAAELTPPGGVVWRYDPIIVSSATPVGFHLETFSRIAAALEGTVNRVVVSFLDVYRKTARGLAELAREGVVVSSEEEQRAAAPRLLPGMAEISRRHGMEIQSCAENGELARYGVVAGKCIDDALILSLHGISVPATKDSGQRSACRCVQSRDIGVYDSCIHGCRYCYATTSRERALETFRKHQPGEAAIRSA